jgi:hypothetical protein
MVAEVLTFRKIAVVFHIAQVCFCLQYINLHLHVSGTVQLAQVCQMWSMDTLKLAWECKGILT